jgi:hypothetical protein
MYIYAASTQTEREQAAPECQRDEKRSRLDDRYNQRESQRRQVVHLRMKVRQRVLEGDYRLV